MVSQNIKDVFHAAMILNRPNIYLIDMPQLLIRLRIAEENSLESLKDMFDFVLNKVANLEGPIEPAACAHLYYP